MFGTKDHYLLSFFVILALFHSLNVHYKTSSDGAPNMERFLAFSTLHGSLDLGAYFAISALVPAELVLGQRDHLHFRSKQTLISTNNLLISKTKLRMPKNTTQMDPA